jgi:hypothetical protein
MRIVIDGGSRQRLDRLSIDIDKAPSGLADAPAVNLRCGESQSAARGRCAATAVVIRAGALPSLDARERPTPMSPRFDHRIARVESFAPRSFKSSIVAHAPLFLFNQFEGSRGFERMGHDPSHFPLIAPREGFARPRSAAKTIG